MEPHSQSKSPPKVLFRFSSEEAGESIAGEVSAHLSALESLCRYVGWNPVAEYLTRAQTELTACMKRKPAEGNAPAVEESLYENERLVSNVIPLKRL